MIFGKNTWKIKTAKYFILALLSVVHDKGVITGVAAGHTMQPEESLPSTQYLNEVELIYHKDFPCMKPRYDQSIPECSLRHEQTGNRYPVLQCTEHIKLLLSTPSVNLWKKEQKQQGYVNLHAKQITRRYVKAHIHAFIISIKPGPTRTEKFSHNTDMHPVRALFIRHALNVRTYQFKNLQTGVISTINATTDHPFYSKNKQAFIPIGSASGSDRFTTDTGQEIRLICLKKNAEHCGTPYKNGQLTTVYNMTTDLKHTYFVGNKNHILVHNCSALHDKETAQMIKKGEGEGEGEETVETIMSMHSIPKKLGIRFVLSKENKMHQGTIDENWYELCRIKAHIATRKQGTEFIDPYTRLKATHIKNFHDELVEIDAVLEALQNPRSGRFFRGIESMEDVNASYPEESAEYHRSLRTILKKSKNMKRAAPKLKELYEGLPEVLEHNLAKNY